MRRPEHVLIFTGVLALATPAGAQSSRSQDRPEQPVEIDPLGGPAVEPESVRKTLISFDYSGRLRRLDVPAEEGALELLDLDAETRAAADKIVSERDSMLDRIVVENLDLLLKLNTAKAAGDRKDVLALLREFSTRLAPLQARGRLRDELAAVLPGAARSEFDGLVGEYWKAAVEDRLREMPKGTTPRAAAARETLLAVGQEVGRSVERQVAVRAADLDEFVKSLDLSADQESRVRKILTDFYQENRGEATPARKRRLVAAVMAELDPSQKKRLIEAYLAR